MGDAVMIQFVKMMVAVPGGAHITAIGNDLATRRSAENIAADLTGL